MNNFNEALAGLDGGGGSSNDDIMPVTFEIQMYKTTASSQDTETSLLCTAEQPVFVKITATRVMDLKTVTKALLKIRKSGGTATGMALYYATANNTVYYHSSHVAVKEITSGGASYLTANLSNIVEDDVNNGLPIYLALVPAENSTSACLVENHLSANAPEINLTYLADDDFIPNVPVIENSVGSKGKYTINVRNGKLFYSQSVFAANGNCLPFNLSVTYNASDRDNNAPNGTTGVMKGWTFNYAQTLRSIGSDYVYLDGTHKYHTFKKAQNSDYTYNDVSAVNGSYLTTLNSQYEISDGKTTTLKFDQNKRLEKISVQQGSAVKSNDITYDAEGRLSTVTDGRGYTYSLQYLSGQIIVYKGASDDSDKETLAQITLDADGRITEIKYARSSETYTFEYNLSDKLYSVYDSATQQTATFNYNQSEKISSVYDQVYKNGISAPVQSRFLSYKYMHSYVDTVPYSTNIAMSTNTAGYEFDANGEAVSMSDGPVAALVKGKAFVYKDDFVSQTITTDLKPIHSFEFNKNSMPASEYTLSPSANYSEYTSVYQYVDLTGKPTNDYVFSAEAVIDNDEWGEGSNPTAVSATLLCADEEAGTLHFDPNQNTCQFRATIVNINPTAVKLQAKISVTNTTGNVRFKNLKITPLSSAISRYCVNKSLNGMETHTEHNSSGSATWYEMQKCTLYCDEENGVTNVAFTFRDHLLTQMSMSKNPDSYNVWYNDGKGMFTSVGYTSLAFPSHSYSLSNVKFATVQSSSNRTTFTYVDQPTTDSGNLFKVKSVINGIAPDSSSAVPVAESAEEYDQYFRVCKSTDINGIETTYSYDSYGNVISVTTNPASNTSLNVKQSFTYNANHDIATETDYRTWEVYQTSYTYNDQNLLTSVKTPINQTTNYTYTADQEKLQSVSATLSLPYYTATNGLAYNGDFVDSLTANGTTFRFAYDKRNDVKSVSVKSTEDETVFNFESQSNVDDPQNASRIVTFGNGHKVKYCYDNYGRLIEVRDTTDVHKLLAFYIYSTDILPADTQITNPKDPQLIRTSDALLRRAIMLTSQTEAVVTDYIYNDFRTLEKTERHVKPVTVSLTDNVFTLTINTSQALSDCSVEITQKDVYGRNLNTNVECESNINLLNSCTYESFASDSVTQQITEVKSANTSLATVQTDYTTDSLKRMQSVKVTVNGNGYSKNISYVPRQIRQALPGPGGGFEPIFWSKAAPVYKTETVGTTYYPLSVTTKEIRNNDVVETETLSFTYDANGNITTYGYNTYTYDKFNRLTRENNYYLDKTITWAYDVGGNITSRKEYAFTTSTTTLGTPIKTYTYAYGNDWKDQLTSYNGYECVYDSAGNPTNYRWNTLTWEGRLLKSFKTVLGSQPSTMTYTADGMRASKVEPYGNGTKSHYYTYNGSTLVQEKIVTSGSQTTEYLTFLYNSEGLTGFVHNSTVYTYRRNLFGDIIAIYQGNTKVAEYAYDAYGNCTIVFATGNAGILNPFRYRGYYYDSDIELYYLQSRYYDPETGRFINADDVSYLAPETIHGLNLYTYCLNNPVMFIDPTGHEVQWWQWLILGIVAVASTVFAIATMGVGFAIASTVASAAIGALYGYSMAQITGQDVGESIGISVLTSIALGNLASTFAYSISKLSITSFKGFMYNFLTSALIGGFSEYIAQSATNGNSIDFGKIILSGTVWGLLNSVNIVLGVITEINVATTLIGGYIYSALTGMIGFLIDFFKQGGYKPKRRNNETNP